MTNMYLSRSKTLLSAAIESLVYKRGRRPMANDITRKVHWEMHCRSEGPVFSIMRPMDYFMLPTERAAFQFNLGPPLKVRFLNAYAYWIDEPAHIPLPLKKETDVVVVDVPIFNREIDKLTVMKRVFGFNGIRFF